MIQENEIVLLLLGVGVFIFMLGSRQRLRRLPAAGILFAGFYILLAGWTLTILEGFLLQEFVNFFEHACYAASAILVAAWCWKVFGKEEDWR